MKLKHIDLPMAKIEQFCQKWSLTELSLFGSVLRDDFRPESSDIDVLIQYCSDAVPTFYDLDCMEIELEQILGREVDVITRAGVEQSNNYLRRHAIFSSAKVMYELRSSIAV